MFSGCYHVLERLSRVSKNSRWWRRWRVRGLYEASYSSSRKSKNRSQYQMHSFQAPRWPLALSGYTLKSIVDGVSLDTLVSSQKVSNVCFSLFEATLAGPSRVI